MIGSKLSNGILWHIERHQLKCRYITREADNLMTIRLLDYLRVGELQLPVAEVAYMTVKYEAEVSLVGFERASKRQISFIFECDEDEVERAEREGHELGYEHDQASKELALHAIKAHLQHVAGVDLFDYDRSYRLIERDPDTNWWTLGNLRADVGEITVSYRKRGDAR